MRSWRRWRLEWPILAGPETALPVVALVVFTGLHATLPRSGAESWARLFVENCQSLLPLALALAAVPALLRDAEHGTVEAAIVLPSRAVLATRLAVILGGGGALCAAWLGVLALLWGPVAFGAGLWAAAGPTLFLAGLGLLLASASGRSTVGYLAVIGWATGDLVLRLLGAFRAVPALQWCDVFAFRWPLPAPGWPAVAGGQGAFGAALLLATLLAARPLLRRLL